MPNSSGPLAFNPSPETPIHVVGDLTIDHLVAWRPHYKRGTPPRDNNPCPTAYNVQAQTNWRTYGGYPFMAHVLRSWIRDRLKRRAGTTDTSETLTEQAVATIPMLNELDGDSGQHPDEKNLQHLYWHLKQFKKTRGADDMVYRLTETAYVDEHIDAIERKNAISDFASQCSFEKTPACTVIVDRNYGFRDLASAGAKPAPWLHQEPEKDSSDNPVQDGLSDRTESLENAQVAPSYICTVDNALPDSASPLWSGLRQHAPHRTMVVISAKLLRASGYELSHRLSWEKTVEDYVELHKGAAADSPLAFLRQFRWVIMLCGVTGCVLTVNGADGEASDATHDFVFDPNPPVPFFRNLAENGRMRANKSMLVAGVVKALAEAGSGDSAAPASCEGAILSGIKDGLRMCQHLYRTGMGRSVEVGKSLHRHFVTGSPSGAGYHRPDWWGGKGPGSWFDRKSERVMSIFEPDQNNFISHLRYVPAADDVPWEILGYAQFGGLEMRANWIGSAHRIVLDGVKKAMNCSPHPRTDCQVIRTRGDGDEEAHGLTPLSGPVVSYGKLTAILRTDIENFNGIRNMLRNYHRQWSRGKASKPLSIAVFGPPGTGKSFAVSQIANSISQDLHPLSFNVAQFDDTEQLVSALIEVRDVNLEGKLPLVFFDEFDSKAPGAEKPLGWLKYFLAPMEDGKFLMPRKGMLRVGHAIFVFAGGTSQTYETFAGIEQPELMEVEEFDQYRIDLREQKGNDFISRLRGHVNIPGINLVDKATRKKIADSWRDTQNRLMEVADSNGHKEEAEDIYPYLQRAIILRSMLEMDDLILPGSSRAMIDQRVVAALLRVKEYRFGARSMGAVLKMCHPMNGDWILPVSVPSNGQLAMHIDGEDEEFEAFRKQLKTPAYRVDIKTAE